MRILVINGPNLNLLGTREKEVYGEIPFERYLEKLKASFSSAQIDFFQSNHEGAIIDEIQRAGFSYDGIVLNAGGYTHTSVAIADAVRAVPAPVVEVHISNVHAREEYRRRSLLAPACRGTIAGFGLDSYRLAIESFFNQE